MSRQRFARETSAVMDQHALEPYRDQLSDLVTRKIGPLFGTSFSIDSKAGWHINLRVLRKMSTVERREIKAILNQLGVPVCLVEAGRPPKLFAHGSETYTTGM